MNLSTLQRLAKAAKTRPGVTVDVLWMSTEPKGKTIPCKVLERNPNNDRGWLVTYFGDGPNPIKWNWPACAWQFDV